MITPSYPGVYLEEVPSGVRPITGVATSITAMVGRTQRGPVNWPVRVQSFGEFERIFGGLWEPSSLSYAVQHFFLCGGTDAIIVRVYHPQAAGPGVAPPMSTFAGAANWIQLQAATQDRDNPGTWARNLSATIDLDTRPGEPNLFNLTIKLHQDPTTGSLVLSSETFRNISTDPASKRYALRVLAEEAKYVRMTAPPGIAVANAITMFDAATGNDGGVLVATDVYSAALEAPKQGLFALENADLFNLLYIPPLERGEQAAGADVLAGALTYCLKRRAMLISDGDLNWSDPATAGPAFEALRLALGGMDSGKNAMAYVPWLRKPDPLQENRLNDFPPGASLAGIMARTDSQRGVWKAPAGIEAGLVGVRELTYNHTDGENGQLNPLGLNCLRTKVPYGHIAWGARTLAGDDRFASEWKYIPIRRTALYIEESLFRGLHWVVFEPNDEPLWAQIRMNTKAFMQNLFKKGAFQGTSPKEAYFVKCDRENNPQSQIDLGIVTVTVGFAPLKPAEFVIIQIQQMAGQQEA